MRIGLDVGSTTIKCAVCEDDGTLRYSAYERHLSHINEKGEEMLQRILKEQVKGEKAYFAISGSAGMGLSERCGVPFVQEVFATRVAAERLSPDTDCVIELGGEDAKILFLTGGTEVRMNGSCAGGTGAFIDQMATLLKLDASEMNDAAKKAERTYTIASRCGVFAKSDVQPLINQGAKAGDIAASIYQAVVNQTIAGLAQGREIKGNVLYLGGPLTFSSCLRDSFDRTLKIQGTCPEHSLLYVALGAAFYADQEVDLKALLKRLSEKQTETGYQSLPPLFESREEYWEFHNRHQKASINQIRYEDRTGRIHIGIDSGSTTIKLIAIDDAGKILYSWYHPNEGNPITLVKKCLIDLYEKYPDIDIASVTTTGYGEELIKHAFHCDFGLVETIAHFTAARHFMPDVDFIIDIGGQDMKCFRIENQAISNIFLNEACSSGCGSFLQTFAEAMNSDVQEFARMGIYARHPVDLGSRCTVFMNSQVKQAQKDGASIEDISAGLSISVVKNALYKVIRCSGPDDLGKHIVVQGGTFYNESVLRAFELEIGREVIRPNIAGLMGTYGAALYGKAHCDPAKKSTVLTRAELEKFEQKVSSVACQGCGNHCQLTVSLFSDGKRFISGNRCEKPVTGRSRDDHLNFYAWKRNRLASFGDVRGELNEVIGLPRCLNMYELLPFWHTLFVHLGFSVLVSPFSDHKMYQSGQGTIPSDTACYPAKLAHGHIHWLCENGADTIFYPCMSYNMEEGRGENHYNCPVVAYYPEVLADNCRELESIRMIHEYVDLSNRAEFLRRFPKLFRKYWKNRSANEIRKAIRAAYAAYDTWMQEIREEGMRLIEEARAEGKRIIVLAGRPYHADPEVSHGIDQLITKLGPAVLSEDAICHLDTGGEVNVLNQWTYHSRLYAAAHYVRSQPDMDLVQLVSFGCGLDAITSDETRAILQEGGKLYTQLKIDEITNLGTVNIRLRSLIAALEEQNTCSI
ncbi:MAG: 2-hydroxyacyl-CoA dehydratase [Solobacterium sp.]|nr:2-hydroxyacyl-CoA dehydratase [Solobacterium sp.]